MVALDMDSSIQYGTKYDANAQGDKLSWDMPCPLFYWTCVAVLICSLLASAPEAQAQSQAQSRAQDAATDVVTSPTPGTSTIISRDIIVKAGDSLQSISKRELGRAGFAPMLAEFNSLVESAPLIAGNIVRIPVHVPARGEFAEVVFVKGSVTVMRAGNSAGASTNSAPLLAGAVSTAANGATLQQPVGGGNETILERNAQIYSGDTIVTGQNGYVSISFSTGSVINLQPGTTATLQRLNCMPTDDSCLIEVSTQAGNLSSSVESRNAQPVEFKISTPYATAAVRGTVFDFNADEELKLGVTEGVVDVSAQRRTVGVNTGFGVLVEPGQEPSKPFPLMPAPVFKRVPSRLAPGDTVGWWPFEGIQTYGASLSTDEAANDTLQTFEVQADRIGFNSINTGDYYLTVRAVDENGLQGFTSNTRLTIAQIDPSIEPVTTTVSQAGREFLVTVQDGPEIAQGYEIQISTDGSFSDPLSVDVNERGSAVFRLDNDRVFTRARVLVDTVTVSAFGEVSSSGN